MPPQVPPHTGPPSPPDRPDPKVLIAAFVGSLLMFVGWLLAIVPAFQHLASVWPVIAIASVAFALVLIPSGLNFFYWPATSDSKRGIGAILWSVIPALVLIVITVAILPIPPVVRILAVVAELVGMGFYGWAWWTHRNPPDAGSRAVKRAHPAS